jgi:hypothetical protein
MMNPHPSLRARAFAAALLAAAAFSPNLLRSQQTGVSAPPIASKPISNEY